MFWLNHEKENQKMFALYFYLYHSFNIQVTTWLSNLSVSLHASFGESCGSIIWGKTQKYIVLCNKLLLGYSLLPRGGFFKKLLWDISYAPQENFTYKKLKKQVLHPYFAISLRSANVWSTFERLLQFGYLSLFYLITKYKKT